MATQDTVSLGEEARTAFARLLLERVRRDKYPSVSHLDLIEQVMPPTVIRDYLNVLLEKVAEDAVPSIPMLARIARVSQQI
ncbi:MAG TPA: hypothetical protein VJU60_04390 [Thermoleophilaceae bacterium]|nr:hypothetical protein [Thermoleophilaceae bacterium]